MVFPLPSHFSFLHFFFFFFGRCPWRVAGGSLPPLPQSVFMQELLFLPPFPSSSCSTLGGFENLLLLRPVAAAEAAKGKKNLPPLPPKKVPSQHFLWRQKEREKRRIFAKKEREGRDGEKSFLASGALETPSANIGIFAADLVATPLSGGTHCPLSHTGGEGLKEASWAPPKSYERT